VQRIGNQLACSLALDADWTRLRLEASTSARTGMISDEVARNLALVQRVFAHYKTARSGLRAVRECLRLAAGQGPKKVQTLLAELAPCWSDHAIASVYALLMPRERRKRLGVYLTPPHLVDHLLRRLREVGLDTSRDRIRDPAAGGAAFLVPLAREMTAAWKARGMRSARIVSRLKSRLMGREIDPGLASVANALLRRMLVREFDVPPRLVQRLRLVRVADSLRTTVTLGDAHEIGNPPYLRLSAGELPRWKSRFSDIASGRLNLYAMFVRRALAEVPANGLVGHIVPASFLGGPEFARFRRRVMELAEVVVLDLIEKRKDVFHDVTQDACFLVLRRRPTSLARPPAALTSSGILGRTGDFALSGAALLAADGSPWSLPGPRLSTGTSTLADYGYRATVGYLVANRQADRLHRRSARARFPLAWAKSVTPRGRFDFERGCKAGQADGRGFVAVPRDAPYVVRVPCVLVQRTSSSNQSRRRLVAAAVPRSFLRRYGGIVGENHIIVLVPTRPDAVSPAHLAAVLNRREASEALARVCGSASISVRVLESLPLPTVPLRTQTRLGSAKRSSVLPVSRSPKRDR